LLRLPVEVEPDNDLLPLQLPEAVQVLALAELHEIVLVDPAMILDGVADMDTVGAGVGLGLVGVEAGTVGVLVIVVVVGVEVLVVTTVVVTG
jgi:hypothetical protein